MLAESEADTCKSMGLRHPDITLRELEVLCELEQKKSLRSLGRARSLQPSHVSKILKRLEAKLGTTLVKRSAKGVVLTPDGTRLAEVAREIVSTAQEFGGAKAGRKKDAPRPLVTVAGPRFVCSELIAPAAEALRRTAAFRFRILDMSPDELIPAAFDSAFEIGVTLSPPHVSAAWDVKKLGELRWGLYASKDHPLAPVASQSEVLAYPFLVPCYWTGKRFEAGDDQCPVSWKDRINGDETSSALTAMEVIRRCQVQLVFAPSIVAARYVAAGELREIRVKEWAPVSKPFFLMVRADKVGQGFHKKLIAELKELLRSRN